MATFKEALTTSLTNFAKSIAKTYPKTANIVDNLLSTDSTLPLSAKQGNVLQAEIDTLNSNKLSHGNGIGTNSVLYHAYNNAGIPLNSGIKTLVIATDSDSMAYGVYIASYVHDSYLNMVNILNGGIQADSHNHVGTIQWVGHTGTVSTFVIPIA